MTSGRRVPSSGGATMQEDPVKSGVIFAITNPAALKSPLPLRVLKHRTTPLHLTAGPSPRQQQQQRHARTGWGVASAWTSALSSPPHHESMPPPFPRVSSNLVIRPHTEHGHESTLNDASWQQPQPWHASWPQVTQQVDNLPHRHRERGTDIHSTHLHAQHGIHTKQSTLSAFNRLVAASPLPKNLRYRRTQMASRSGSQQFHKNNDGNGHNSGNSSSCTTTSTTSNLANHQDDPHEQNAPDVSREFRRKKAKEQRSFATKQKRRRGSGAYVSQEMSRKRQRRLHYPGEQRRIRREQQQVEEVEASSASSSSTSAEDEVISRSGATAADPKRRGKGNAFRKDDVISDKCVGKKKARVLSRKDKRGNLLNISKMPGKAGKGAAASRKSQKVPKMNATNQLKPKKAATTKDTSKHVAGTKKKKRVVSGAKGVKATGAPKEKKRSMRSKAATSEAMRVAVSVTERHKRGAGARSAERDSAGESSLVLLAAKAEPPSSCATLAAVSQRTRSGRKVFRPVQAWANERILNGVYISGNADRAEILAHVKTSSLFSAVGDPKMLERVADVPSKSADHVPAVGEKRTPPARKRGKRLVGSAERDLAVHGAERGETKRACGKSNKDVNMQGSLLSGEASYSLKANNLPMEWSNEEVIALKVAHGSINPATRGFWNRVSAAVKGRSGAECQAKYESLYPTPKRGQATRHRRVNASTGRDQKEKKEELILPAKGRAPQRRRRILRRIVEEANAQHSGDDAFCEDIAGEITHGSRKDNLLSELDDLIVTVPFGDNDDCVNEDKQARAASRRRREAYIARVKNTVADSRGTAKVLRSSGRRRASLGRAARVDHARKRLQAVVSAVNSTVFDIVHTSGSESDGHSGSTADDG